jgi:hypothetical protein
VIRGRKRWVQALIVLAFILFVQIVLYYSR